MMLKFKNFSPTTEELRRFTLLVEVNDEYQKYLTSRNMEKLPIDDSDDFVTPSPKQIKEHVPPKKAPGVQPVDYDRELQKLKAGVKQLKSFMEYVSDKFKEVFELINSKLGASKDKYGAHPEKVTNGRQDNNDFVSNMEFSGNEDVDVDGCKKKYYVGGSEGKDAPHSQGDTSAHHRNNIVLDAADRLGVNVMEEPSSVKVNMFAAKMEIKSEKEKVPKSQTGVVCVTASVDEAAGEMKEQYEKEVPKAHIVLYKPELLPEVSPQMEKRKKCPAKVMQSPFITVSDLRSSSGVVAAKEKKQIYVFKHPFQSKIKTGVNSSLLNVFPAWIKEGKSRKKYVSNF
ncbi:hypothetical protein A4A49_11323 [Nicotiana attenuata]|uniref:Uncharacterized protein n=1 Tax=Nicotiana attenuata TaxID=49451 RepID=A0A314L7V5_NICAT|nr:hypothetical protein A4A49_11323 [Nicotiana attenuata]